MLDYERSEVRLMDMLINEIKGNVLYITINRPEKRNALNPELISLLTSTFKAAINDNQIKAIVLQANGEVFSAGADLAYLQEMQNYSYEENLADSNALKNLFYTIYTCPKIVIAQVEGHAIAGGCGLASICDIVFSTPEAKFGYTEVKIGFIPAIVSCFLVRKLGEARSKELLLSGELIDAETASRYGLINFVVEKNVIRESVKKYAEKIANNTSAQSVSLTKSMLNVIQNSSLEDNLENAAILNAKSRSTEDCKKGIAAFMNRNQDFRDK